MKLVATVLRRLRDGVIVLWAAASLTFLGMQHSGGDTALAIVGGPDAMPSAELLAQVRAEYGLDQPLWRQYLSYLGRLAQGDLGESYRLRIPVVQAIGEQLG
ncbi:MAG: ABC transporter permease, partial [Pseudomonas sp.]